MRIAVLIIGLLLGAIMFFQSLAVTALGDAANTDDDGAAGSIGVFMALLWLVACAIVVPFPRIAMALFLVAGVFGIGGGAGTDYSDLYIWGVISLVLAVFSYLGYRGKRNKDIKERLRDEQMAQMVQHNQAMATAMQQQQWAQWHEMEQRRLGQSPTQGT
jgi:uncharacterized membrane protein